MKTIKFKLNYFEYNNLIYELKNNLKTYCYKENKIFLVRQNKNNIIYCNRILHNKIISKPLKVKLIKNYN